MKGALAALLGGAAVAVGATFAWDALRRRGALPESLKDAGLGEQGRRTARQKREARRPSRTRRHAAPGIDLNSASEDQLRGAGIEDQYIERILEHRPYRNKLDLVSQMVLPGDVYERIKHSVRVARSDESVKVA